MTYRWSGTTYVTISSSLALGETSSTAYAGDKGKALSDNLSAHKEDAVIHITSSERTAWNGKYTKLETGIPKSDLNSAVQASLNKADTALQSLPSHTHDDRYYTESEIDTKLSGKSDTGHTHNVIYNYLTSRPASANLAIIGDGGFRVFKATSTMTTGKPEFDGHIMHLAWDNAGGFDTEFFVPNNGGANIHCQYRSQSNGTWGDWVTLARLDEVIPKTEAGLNAAINLLSTGSSTPTDNDYYISQYVGGGTTTTSYHRRPMSALWSYISGKMGSTYLPLSGGTITGAILGNVPQKGLLVKSVATDRTGGWTEGIYVENCSSGYSVMALGDATKKNVLGFVQKSSTKEHYIDVEENGTNKTIKIPFDSGTLALTKDIPTTLPANGGTADRASYLNNQGVLAANTGTSRNVSGFCAGMVYNSGYPFSYGTSWRSEVGFGAELIFNGLGGGGATGSGEMRFRTQSDWANSEWGDWRTVIDSANIGSQSVQYANEAGNADTLDGWHFNDGAISGSPSYVYGRNSGGGGTIRRFYTGQLSVANADTVDGYHADSFVKGATVSYTVTLNLSHPYAWVETGIEYNNVLADGMYLVQVFANSNGPYWGCRYTGIMTWYSGGTNNNDEREEIILHRTGHAANFDAHIYLSTKGHEAGGKGVATLEIASNIATNKNVNYNFYFKRIDF